MIEWLRKRWCELAHGGGRIQHDPQGRVNWRCSRCGRWADPVPTDELQRIVDSATRHRT